MSDADGGPSTSRGTRKSGVTTPQTNGSATTPSSSRMRDSRESTAASGASSGTPLPSFASNQERLLYTPDYGGNLFTAPSSKKRETKKNSRFSPVLETKRQVEVKPTKKQTASERSNGSASALDDDSRPKKTVRNLKDMVPRLVEMMKTMKQRKFRLPDKFGGKAAELYRQLPVGQRTSREDTEESEEPSTSAKTPRQRSVGAARATPVPGQPTTAAQRKQRGRSIPAGGARAAINMETESVEAKEDHPPRGRRGRAKAPEESERDESQESHSAPMNVKQEVFSDNEEMQDAPVPQPANRRARNRASLPPQLQPSQPAAGGRRKSGVAAKEEPMDEDEEAPPQPRAGRRSTRGDNEVNVRFDMSAEENEPEKATPKPRGRGRGRSEKRDDAQEAPLAEEPSTSGAAAAAAADNRSTSRKRGRPSAAAAETSPADTEETSKVDEPAAKRKDTRRSTRSIDGEETAEEVVEQAESSTPSTGKQRHRRTASQLLVAGLREDEKGVEQTEEGHATRRRSFRGNADDAAAAATATPTSTTTRPSARVPKPPPAQPATASQVAGRLRAEWDDEPQDLPDATPTVRLNSHDLLADNDVETRGEKKAKEPKPSTSSRDTIGSHRMLEEEEGAEESSGYDADASQEVDGEPEDAVFEAEEGEKKEEEEEQASTSAAAAAPTPKRGRGRPRLHPPKEGAPPPKPKKEKEPVSPKVRERRSTTLNNPIFQEYMKGESTKIAKRASAGGGIAHTPRTLAAAGVPFDLPSPRVRAPTPPPPEVKAQPGSALSIMRDVRNKKVPSMRSPSPVPARSATSSNSKTTQAAAAAAKPVDAPPPAASAAEKKEEEEDTLSGPTDQPSPGSTQPSQPARGTSGAPEKEEGEEEESKDENKEEEEDDEVQILEGSSQEKKDKPIVWITPDNIRGNAPGKQVVKEYLVTDELTGKLKKETTLVPAERKKKGEEKEKEEEQEKEEEPKEEENPPESAAKREESTPPAAADGSVMEDLLAKWEGSRHVIDQVRLEAGVPVLPPEPLASRATRRSINAPARYGDYDLNYGDVRKRSATVNSPATLQLSPALPEANKRKRKREEAAVTPTVSREKEEDGEEEEGEGDKPSTSKGSKSKSKKDKKRPPIVLKFRLGKRYAAAAAATAAAEEGEEEEQEQEDAEEPYEDDGLAETESGGVLTPSYVATPTATPSSRRTRDNRRSTKKFAMKKYKRRPVPHLGYIELDDKRLESVTMVCAATIDDMLKEICGDHIQKSTLTQKEQASEQSRLSMARRRLAGTTPSAHTGSRPKHTPHVIPPREERTKRIRHAPMSKEYDNLATGVLETVATPSFHALAGMTERKPSERRKESRQDAAIKKASVVAVDRLAAEEVETPVIEKPKKEKKRDRDRERERERREKEKVVIPKNAISYAELVRQKTHDLERLPGRVLSDPTDFFYREMFTDDLGEGRADAGSLDVDVDGFREPMPDDMKAIGPNGTIGVLAGQAATKLLQILPRPAPFPDEDDDGLDEEREWLEEDMKKALAQHSAPRRNRVEQVLAVINTQRMADLAVQGTKGSQDILYNSHVKQACRLKELLPVFSQIRLAESSWLHRSMIRLLPAHLLPVYLEILRFLRYMDSKLAAELSKSLQQRGVDAEWDALFAPEPKTEDDRTQPMLNGSEPATASCSAELIPVVPAAAAADSADVAATMEAVLKALEKAEMDAVAAAAAAPASPDSPQGLVIDEGEEPAAEPTDAAAPVEPKREPSVVEDVAVEEVKKPEMKLVAQILSEVTDRKVREVNADTIQDSINPLSLGDVLPILIAPVFEMDDAPEEFVLKNRNYEYMYRLIRYATPTPDKFKPIRPRIPAGQCSVAEAMDAAVDCVVAAVKHAVKNKGNGRVILFGWGLSCYINLRVAQLLHGISAIINFAFPLKTMDGWRGTPDDDINLTYCPTLFVMGAEAEDFDATQLLMMRMSMIQPSGALILGSSDTQLNVANLRLSRERITQKIAARMIIEQVIEFINLPANQLERAKLVPLQLNNVYFVDPVAMKTYTTQEGQQAALATGRRTSTYTPRSDEAAGMPQAQMIERRRMQQEKEKEKERRKRSRIEDQTTVAGRLASSIAASAAPITKRSRTDDLPSTSYGGRIGGDHRFSAPGPSPLASPALKSPGYRTMNRPAILSHNNHHNYHSHYQPAQPSPIASGPSTSAAAAASSSGLLLQTATTRPANAAAAAAPSPRGPLDPASISLS